VLGLERMLEHGHVRAIGTSNFKPAHLQRVIDQTGIVVDVNQIQLSPYTTRDASRAFDAEHGIVTESWSPIGGQSDDLRSDPVITEIAERHGKSPTQAVLRWHIQLGLVTVPKSGNPARIAENIDIFDFALTDDEMAAISALDRGESEASDSDTFGH
jgi:2,5-diketo-D-gluconate reductase A